MALPIDLSGNHFVLVEIEVGGSSSLPFERSRPFVGALRQETAHELLGVVHRSAGEPGALEERVEERGRRYGWARMNENPNRGIFFRYWLTAALGS